MHSPNQVTDLSKKHPSMYEMFFPNPLITSRVSLKDDEGGDSEDKPAPLTVNEQKLLAMVAWTIGNSPTDTKYYSIRYDDVVNRNTLLGGNRKAIIKSLRDTLHKRYIKLEKKYDHLFTDIAVHGNASINLFITIVDEKTSFKLQLHPVLQEAFKQILSVGFTRSDVESIRTLTTSPSLILYYEIRKWQSMRKNYQISLDELKHKLYLTDKYPDWSDFDKRVLKKSKEEHENLWTSFDYEPVKEKKNKVNAVLFKFKNGPQEEKDLPAGSGFKWEKTLKAYGIFENDIKQFRNYVNAGTKHHLGFVWDEDYILFTMEKFRLVLSGNAKDPRIKKIKSPKGYLYKSLMNGWWIQYVSERKQMGQLQLAGMTENDIKPSFTESSLRNGVSPAVDENLSYEVAEDEDVTPEWMALYNEVNVNKKWKSFESFMKERNFIVKDGKVVPK